MMSINDWRDGVCGFVAGLKPEHLSFGAPRGERARDWTAGYEAAQGWAMDHALKGSIAAVKAAEEWAHAPQAMNRGLAASAVNQEGTGQHPTDQWPGRTIHAMEKDTKTIFGCLDAQSSRMNQHEGRLDMIDGQMAGIAADLRVIILRLDDYDRRCDVHADDLKRVHARLDVQDQWMDRQTDRMNAQNARITATEGSLEQHSKHLTEHWQLVSRIKDALNG